MAQEIILRDCQIAYIKKEMMDEESLRSGEKCDFDSGTTVILLLSDIHMAFGLSKS
jgi:hypothetical protein